MTDESPGAGRRRREQLESSQLIDAVRVREQFLEDILGSLESFVTVDQDWRFTFANRTAAKLIGKLPDELLGQSLLELTPTGALEQASAPLQQAMSERLSVEFEVGSLARGSVYHGQAYPLADGGLAIYIRDVTAMMRSQEERAQAEERYRELVQNVNSAILRWSSDGTLTFFNEYAERLFGWRSEEVVGRHVSILLPEADDKDGRTDLAEKLVKDPDRYTTHVNENARKDGSRLWMAWTNHAARDDEGAVREMLAVGTDITELVQAQSALRESEERFRALADQSPFLIWVTDAAGDVEFVNRTYLEFFDVSEEDIAGAGWTPLVHPDDRDRYVGEFLAATREQRPFACEARVKSGSGEWRWIDSHGVPRFSASGEFLGMVGSSPDVTDRKRIEHALRDNEALLRTVLDHSRDGINMLDLKTGRYVFMNPAQVLLTGFTTEEINGISAEEAYGRVHPDDREVSVAQQQRVAAGEDVDEPVEYRWKVKDGEYRWFSDRRKIVRDEEGDPVALVGISRDITEQKRTETALRQSEGEKAAQRERSRLARELHDSVTQALFAATMKSEALTLDGELPARSADTVEEVRRLTRGALAQMRTLLLELRADPLEEIPIQQLLRHLVEATESRVRTVIRLSVNEPATLPGALHVPIYRIVQEALNNVARHAAAAHAWVVLDVRPSDVRLVVGDDGRGFDPDAVDPSHLGLRSMRERAEEAGARLCLETSVGGGTQLTVDWSEEGLPAPPG
ncbi:MAG: PAS domain S-box protein [Syntrophomonadaceae bacterium]